MNQCPVCSGEIQDSFGLVECPSCHKILFADFDGTLKVHEDSPVPFSIKEEEIPVHELDENVNSQKFDSDWNLINENPPPLDSLDPIIELDLGSAKETSDEEESETSAVTAPLENLSALEEINRFANSEDSSLKQGALIYNLTISNIDTEELKEEILEVLKENKLNIDVKKLKFALPTLELKDLNPVKVSVIVSKIKHLPIDLEWVQKSAITNGESSVD